MGTSTSGDIGDEVVDLGIAHAVSELSLHLLQYYSSYTLWAAEVVMERRIWAWLRIWSGGGRRCVFESYLLPYAPTPLAIGGQ